jgi:hypothetical protein
MLAAALQGASALATTCCAPLWVVRIGRKPLLLLLLPDIITAAAAEASSGAERLIACTAAAAIDALSASAADAGADSGAE